MTARKGTSAGSGPGLYNPLLRKAVPVRRNLGTYSKDRPGPLLIALAGLHGNEPSGVQAVQAVLAELKRRDVSLRGTFVGIAGNLAALAKSCRFVDEDLNRLWSAERLEELRDGRAPASVEENELRAIDRVIEPLLAEDPERRVFFIDCHSTSSESVPYISVPHHAASVELAGEIPVHSVIGSGDKLKGVSDRYLIDRGLTGFTFEAGHHDRLASVEAARAAVWTMLHRVGCLGDPPIEATEELLRTVIDGHKYYEVEYVHEITPASGFRMKPGFCNFERIREGDLLAWEHDKPIVSRWNARLFLPLYQAQGDDGFSIIREEAA